MTFIVPPGDKYHHFGRLWERERLARSGATRMVALPEPLSKQTPFPQSGLAKFQAHAILSNLAFSSGKGGISQLLHFKTGYERRPVPFEAFWGI